MQVSTQKLADASRRLENQMTKNHIIAALAVLTLTCPSAFAKDAAFDAFWPKFCAALKANDKEAIASMTKIPYQSYDRQLKTKKEFIAYCDKIFSKKIRDCLVKEKPVFDKTYYSAFCGDDIYIFEKVKGKLSLHRNRRE